MTNLSDLFPAGAGKQVSFTASGNVTSSGKPVILNSDGTVSEVSGAAFAVGSAVPLVAAVNEFIGIAYDTGQDRVVILWTELTSRALYMTAGEVSGSSITWGTSVLIFSAIDSGAVYDLTYHSAGNCILYCFEYSTTVYAGVATLSGSTITDNSGSRASVSEGVTWMNAVYDATNSKTLIYAKDDTTPTNVGVCWAVTVSGTTPTFSSSYAWTGSTGLDVANAVHDPDQQRIVIAIAGIGSVQGSVVLIDCSGATPTGTSFISFQATNANAPKITYDTTNDKIVIGYYDNNNSSYLSYIAGTVNAAGSTVTFGTKTTQTEQLTKYPSYASMTFDTPNNQILNSYMNGDNAGVSDYGSYLQNVTLSGTTVVLGDINTISAPTGGSGANYYANSVYDPDTNKVVWVYSLATGDTYGYGKVITPAATNLTSTNFLGISDAAISSAASGNITIKGGIAATGLSSLTPASDYYVQDDGTISTVSSSVKAGKALSATAINLEYTS
jgi:hypothetical protein